MATCRHCHQKPESRPRGLCWKCYYIQGVRELYPSTSKFARRGTGLRRPSFYRIPAESTQARPGSKEKILVMIDSLERGEHLYHPDDLTCFDKQMESE